MTSPRGFKWVSAAFHRMPMCQRVQTRVMRSAFGESAILPFDPWPGSVSPHLSGDMMQSNAHFKRCQASGTFERSCCCPRGALWGHRRRHQSQNMSRWRMIRIVWVIRSLLSFFVSAAVSFFVLKTMVLWLKRQLRKTFIRLLFPSALALKCSLTLVPGVTWLGFKEFLIWSLCH